MILVLVLVTEGCIVIVVIVVEVIILVAAAGTHKIYICIYTLTNTLIRQSIRLLIFLFIHLSLL